MTTFEESFVTEYQVAFNELIRLGQVAAEKNINGRESKNEDEIAQRLLICLKALSSPDLSTAQIEALEYCLRQLNHSLRVPTVTPIVDLEPVGSSIVYRMPTWAGLFRANMQEFTMTKRTPLTMPFDNGSFSLALQDIGFVRSQNMPISNGSFVVSSTVFFSFVPYAPSTDLTLGLSLSEAVAGTPEWAAYFDVTALSVTGNGDTDSGAMTYISSVTVTVYKVSNSGIAEDSGFVDFLRNGIADTPSQTFNVTDDVSSGSPKSYTFTGLSPADSISVQITEG